MFITYYSLLFYLDNNKSSEPTSFTIISCITCFTFTIVGIDAIETYTIIPTWIRAAFIYVCNQNL